MLFNRPRLELLELIRRGAAPGELAYGALELERRGWELDCTDDGFRPGLVSRAWSRLAEDRFSQRGVRVGFNVPQAWRLRDRLAAADAIFATGDAAALGALAVMRSLQIDTPLLAGSIGLAAGLAQRPGRVVQSISGSLLRRARCVVCYSQTERASLIERLGLDPRNVHFVRFGVDLGRHKPADPVADGPALAFGNDRRRDWPTLLRALEGYSGPVRLVTYPEFVRGLALPPNVEYIPGPIPFAKLDRLLEQARMVILPIVPNDYTAAQISLLYSLARAKAVIVSRTAPLESGYGVVHERHALLVEPGNAQSLARAVERLDRDPSLRRDLGAAGRALVEDGLHLERYADELGALLERML
ncbi:MAG: glycosyltransferase [Candidatus Alcyoniella australis]|nr:glycosyltransferase [Candidatus Alcyoniella australis]